jgi:hypothetical protein
MKHFISVLLVTLFILPGDKSFCQASNVLHKYPSAVLLQLPTEHNRIAALKKARRYDDLASVEHDAAEVIQRIRLDFANNFSRCPVFYFVDTNSELVKDRRFEGILFDKDGIQVHNVIAPGDSNYVIAYYGLALSQAKYHREQRDEPKYLTADQILELRAQSDTQTSTLLLAEHDAPSGQGLVILNANFRQITNFYKTHYDEFLFDLKKKKLKRYYYKSKRYDIEYYPFAGLFNRTMLDRYGRRRISISHSLIKY